MRKSGNWANGSAALALVAGLALAIFSGCEQAPANQPAGGGDVAQDVSLGDGTAVDSAVDAAQDGSAGSDGLVGTDAILDSDTGSLTDVAVGTDAVADGVPSDAQDTSSQCPSENPKPNSACTTASIVCNFGQECCCGKCYPSQVCQCAGKAWLCYYTDACMMGPNACPDASDAGPSEVSQPDAEPSDGGPQADTFDQPCNESSSSLTPCAEDQYCAKPEGQCGSIGKCKVKPTVCTKELNQQCGCDNVTYGNPCMAAAAGRAIQYPGPCKPIDGCAIGQSGCGPDEFCAAPEGQCSGTGKCSAKAQVCPMVYKPVCGCDGKTYGNGCSASSAGVVVAFDGECPDVPGACDADANSGCAKSQFCQAPAGQCGGKGVCKPYPQACMDLWAPVCGCDGKTYGNDCEALAKGANVASKGECTGKPLSQFYLTCGAPVCKGWSDKGIPLCTAGQQLNASCANVGETCDPQDACNALLKCALSDPKLEVGGCPK